MTRTTNARVAGFRFLAYIALAYPAMLLFGRMLHEPKESEPWTLSIVHADGRRRP